MNLLMYSYLCTRQNDILNPRHSVPTQGLRYPLCWKSDRLPSYAQEFVPSFPLLLPIHEEAATALALPWRISYLRFKAWYLRQLVRRSWKVGSKEWSHHCTSSQKQFWGVWVTTQSRSCLLIIVLGSATSMRSCFEHSPTAKR